MFNTGRRSEFESSWIFWIFANTIEFSTNQRQGLAGVENETNTVGRTTNWWKEEKEVSHPSLLLTILIIPNNTIVSQTATCLRVKYRSPLVSAIIPSFIVNTKRRVTIRWGITQRAHYVTRTAIQRTRASCIGLLCFVGHQGRLSLCCHSHTLGQVLIQ